MNTNILIVEDDDVTVFLLKRYFAIAGFYNLDFTDNAQSAIEYIDNQKFNIVIMDIDIKGGIDGVDTAKMIRAKSKIPIVFHSNNKIGYITERITPIENVLFVEKDGIYNTLISAVQSLLEQKSLNRS